jgi:hypothetical protein
VSGGSRLDAADLTALDAVLAALGDFLAGARPAARAELRACLRRAVTWPWPADMHVAITFCRLALRNGTMTGGPQ